MGGKREREGEGEREREGGRERERERKHMRDICQSYTKLQIHL